MKQVHVYMHGSLKRDLLGLGELDRVGVLWHLCYFSERFAQYY